MKLLDYQPYKDLPFGKKFEALKLTVKYWATGDEWRFALEYAVSLVIGWKK